MDAERVGGGRYRVVRRLGSGGMAAVVLAEDERLERLVALKRMHSEMDPGLAERFSREARLGASLNHPNVVRVFDVFEEGEEPVTTLVLEYVDGENLAQALRRGPLPPARALRVLEPLAEALDHAHVNGVVHRDVKPANVLIGKDGTVKLSDLGIATGGGMPRVTSSEAVIGSAPYMAPEQLAGDEATAAADIYALATVAFEALSGRRARTGDSPMAIVHQVANHPAPELTEAWAEAPQRASDVLRRGMADKPEDRPESASRLIGDLGAALRAGSAPAQERAAPAAPPPAPTPTPLPPTPTPTPTPPTPPPPAESPPAESPPAESPPAESPRRRRGRAGAVIAGLAALAVVAAIALVALLGGGEEEPTPEREPASKPAAVPSPAAVVRDFYSEAADDRFDAAWKLAGPRARAQLGGFEAFKRQLGTLRSVDFEENRVVSKEGKRASVAIQTRAVHSDRVDNCRGDVSLVRRGDGWLIDRLGVTCG
jgi:serine/threonine protein kinase